MKLFLEHENSKREKVTRRVLRTSEQKLNMSNS